jgi:hypothetical protein
MNINEIKNKQNDAIWELVEETVKRELKHEKIEEVKEELKPELEPGDICEVWDDNSRRRIVLYFKYYDEGKNWFGDYEWLEDKSCGIWYKNYKLIKKANPKNKIVIARDETGDLWLYLNPDNLSLANTYWDSGGNSGMTRITEELFPEIKPCKKIEIGF